MATSGVQLAARYEEIQNYTITCRRQQGDKTAETLRLTVGRALFSGPSAAAVLASQGMEPIKR